MQTAQATEMAAEAVEVVEETAVEPAAAGEVEVEATDAAEAARMKSATPAPLGEWQHSAW